MKYNIKFNWINFSLILFIISILLLPFILSAAKYSKTLDIDTISLNIKSDIIDALLSTLDNFSATTDDLTIEYKGNNTYTLNGTSTLNRHTYIRLNHNLKIVTGETSDIKSNLLDCTDTIIEPGYVYDFNIEILDGNISGLTNPDSFILEFNTAEDDNTPKYDFYDNTNNSNTIDKSFNIASLYIGETPLTFNNYTFKINLNKKIKTTINNGAFIEYYGDGIYGINGSTNGKSYIRLAENEIVYASATSDLYNAQLANNPMFLKDDNVKITYNYISGTATIPSNCAITLLFRDTTTNVGGINAPKLSTIKTPTAPDVFDIYGNAELTKPLLKNASQFAMYISENIVFDNFKFYVSYEKIEEPDNSNDSNDSNESVNNNDSNNISSISTDAINAASTLSQNNEEIQELQNLDNLSPTDNQLELVDPNISLELDDIILEKDQQNENNNE